MATKKRKGKRPPWPWVTEVERKREKSFLAKAKWTPIEAVFGRRGVTRGYLIKEHERKIRYSHPKKRKS